MDLFVRVSNTLAITMYKAFGYIVYRTVTGYYTGLKDGEDAYGKKVIHQLVDLFLKHEIMNELDMRKALPRDVDKSSMIPLLHPVPASALYR